MISFPLQIDKELKQLPNLIKELRTVVAARMDEDGNLIEHNRGFAYLLGNEDADMVGINVSNKFINPNFSRFCILQPTTSTVIYQGLITVGNYDTDDRSLHGVVVHRDGELWLIAEHDLIELENLNATVITLNNELSDTQRELVKSNRDLKRKEAEITKIMLTDTLTGIPNRRYFIRELERELKRYERRHNPICIAMCDIDFFKPINDQYGHDVGDDILASIAHTIQTSIRQTDFAARWGGEEFIIMFPDTSCSEACEVSERVRQAVQIQHPPQIDHDVTISLGVTEYIPNETINDLIKRADTALYESKENGRNQLTSIATI